MKPQTESVFDKKETKKTEKGKELRFLKGNYGYGQEYARHLGRGRETSRSIRYCPILISEMVINNNLFLNGFIPLMAV